MPPKYQAKVRQAIDANIEPTTVARSGRLVLKTPAGTVGLADSRGKLSAAGEFYFRTSGRAKPNNLGFDKATPLRKDGPREFVVYRDGSEKLARTWNGSDFKYTRAGKDYFSETKQEYLVSIPVKIAGRNKKTGKEKRAA